MILEKIRLENLLDQNTLVIEEFNKVQQKFIRKIFKHCVGFIDGITIQKINDEFLYIDESMKNLCLYFSI